jgi:hypothetical protein
LPLDENAGAANDVVSITKSKTAKLKGSKIPAHPHRRQENKINALGQPNMSKNCCVGLYQGIHYAMRVIDHNIEITDHGIEITDHGIEITDHDIEMQRAKAQ